MALSWRIGGQCLTVNALVVGSISNPEFEVGTILYYFFFAQVEKSQL